MRRTLLVTTTTPAEEEENEDDHRRIKEMKENFSHPFLHGKKACSFSVHITSDRKHQMKTQIKINIHVCVLPNRCTGTLVSSHVSVGAGLVVASPPALQAGVGAELTGVMVTWQAFYTGGVWAGLETHHPRASGRKSHRYHLRDCSTSGLARCHPGHICGNISVTSHWAGLVMEGVHLVPELSSQHQYLWFRLWSW